MLSNAKRLPNVIDRKGKYRQITKKRKVNNFELRFGLEVNFSFLIKIRFFLC